jgi:virginiamycin B lyase
MGNEVGRARPFLSKSVSTALAILGGLVLREALPAQSISEFAIPTADSSPSDITAGPDDALWFTENASNKIGRITTTGVITEFPILTTDSGPYAITAGPDGALWFTEQHGNKIGRITTEGVVTEFPIPTSPSLPTG